MLEGEEDSDDEDDSDSSDEEEEETTPKKVWLPLASYFIPTLWFLFIFKHYSAVIFFTDVLLQAESKKRPAEPASKSGKKAKLASPAVGQKTGAYLLCSLFEWSCFFSNMSIQSWYFATIVESILG